ncbi:MAG: hypothetical protein ACKO2G_12825 [Verrucomicrobiales bacterium]
MPHQPRPRPAVFSRIEKVRSKPLPHALSMDQHRALRGEKVRQYYAVGDPVEHMRSVAVNRRIGLALGAVVLLFLVVLYFIIKV